MHETGFLAFFLALGPSCLASAQGLAEPKETEACSEPVDIIAYSRAKSMVSESPPVFDETEISLYDVLKNAGKIIGFLGIFWVCTIFRLVRKRREAQGQGGQEGGQQGGGGNQLNDIRDFAKPAEKRGGKLASKPKRKTAGPRTQEEKERAKERKRAAHKDNKTPRNETRPYKV